MTREGFAANNRGIAAGGNLEESFLNEIFDHIRANPISLKEDDQAREKGENQVGTCVYRAAPPFGGRCPCRTAVGELFAASLFLCLVCPSVCLILPCFWPYW